MRLRGGSARRPVGGRPYGDGSWSFPRHSGDGAAAARPGCSVMRRRHRRVRRAVLLASNHPQGGVSVRGGGRYHAEVDREACAFCMIASGAGPAHVVLEDERALAFLDRYPATRGHTLVVRRSTRRTCGPSTNRPSQPSRPWLSFASAVAHLLRERLRPDGLTLFQANERAGWQDVSHLHVHVVPRYGGDGLVRPWQMACDGGRDDLAVVVSALAGRSDSPSH